MGVSIQPEKEIIMTLTPTENKNNIMQAVVEGGKLDENGMGICFSLPVNQVRGISAKYSIKNIKKEEKAEDKKED